MLPGLTGINGAKSFEEFSVEVTCHTDLAEETNVNNQIDNVSFLS